MNPGIPQIDPIPLAAPGAVFRFLLILTFALHLLPMSAVLGGSIIGAVARWRARRGHPHAAELARLMGKLLPVAIAAAVTLGVAALLFLQVLYGRLFFSSSVVMAWFWIAVVPLLIIGYYSAYGVSLAGSGTARPALAWAAVAVFLAIAFIYTNNMTLMLRPGAQHTLHTASALGLQWNVGETTLAPRYLHMLTGAIGLAGLFVAFIGLARGTTSPAFGDWALRHGARWFVIASTANILVGLWFLSSLPDPVMALFIGGSASASLLLAAGIVAALAALGFALGVGQSRAPGRSLAGASGAVLVTLVAMVLTRDAVRQAFLGAAGFQHATWNAPQWGPIAVFGVLLVTAIALVTWMVVALVKAPAAAAPRDVVSV